MRSGNGNTTHGRSGDPTYRSWDAMKHRCSNKKANRYDLYGGKGITVCKRWFKFENFLKDMGERPSGKTLDRKDGTKGYYKDNCRWATSKEQARNTKRNRIITYDGESKSLAEWSEVVGISQDTLKARLNMGWSHIKTIETPLGNNKRSKK
jgi:hypothetical protein